MDKETVLFDMVYASSLLDTKEANFINKHYDDFYDFIKPEPLEIANYTQVSIEALELMHKNNLEGDMLEVITDRKRYIKNKFQEFCIKKSIGGSVDD